MPRRKAPCGTYAAYQRHLARQEEVDALCRRAQRDHDAARRRSGRSTDHAEVVRLETPRRDPQEAKRAAVREMFAKCVVDLDRFVQEDYLYGVVDLMAEMDELLDAWCEAAGTARGEVSPS